MSTFFPWLESTPKRTRGRDREHWQAQALVDLQEAIDDAQRWARDVAGSHCQNLLARADSLLRWPE
ncbi:hypothetical protein ACRAVF_07405 [Bradyrhizobium oligotrophicum S58]